MLIIPMLLFRRLRKARGGICPLVVVMMALVYVPILKGIKDTPCITETRAVRMGSVISAWVCFEALLDRGLRLWFLLMLLHPRWQFTHPLRLPSLWCLGRLCFLLLLLRSVSKRLIPFNPFKNLMTRSSFPFPITSPISRTFLLCGYIRSCQFKWLLSDDPFPRLCYRIRSGSSGKCSVTSGSGNAASLGFLGLFGSCWC